MASDPGLKHVHSVAMLWDAWHLASALFYAGREHEMSVPGRLSTQPDVVDSKPTIESVTAPDLADVAARRRCDKRKKWRTFGIGLSVRLVGLALIWLGDGSPSIVRRAVVVLGVILTVGGIAVLRLLLFSGFRKKK